MPLNLAPNIPDPDSFYEALIHAQRDLDEAAAQKMNSRLILILANHIGDNKVLADAIQAAIPEQPSQITTRSLNHE